MTRSLKHYAEDMGIPKPNVYGQERYYQTPQQLTPNKYQLKKARVRIEDFDKLDPLEFERQKTGSSKSCYN